MTIPYRHLRFLLSIPSRTSVIQHRVYRNPRDTVKRYSNNLSDTCDSRRVGRHKTRHAPNFPEQFSIAPSSKSNSLLLSRTTPIPISSPPTPAATKSKDQEGQEPAADCPILGQEHTSARRTRTRQTEVLKKRRSDNSTDFSTSERRTDRINSGQPQPPGSGRRRAEELSADSNISR